LRIGQASETVAAGRVARAGESVLIDLAQPLHLEYSSEETDTVELTLWVARTHATRAFADLGSLHGAILRSDVPGASVLGAAAQALHSELDRLSAGEIDQLGGGLFDLAARILARVEAKTPASPELESFATICRYVEAHLMARDLGAEKLARTFGLSRASLYRLFESVGGVASYVRARRLNRARQQLQAAGLDDRRIGPIAYQSGFRSVTAFNRAFREAYGHTPRDIRRSRFDPSASISTEPANVGILARSLFAITV
jgi:AraC-like DNA-binding protein